MARTGASARSAHAPFVKQLDKGSRIDAHKRHVQRARHARSSTVYAGIGDFGKNVPLQLIAQRRNARGVACHIFAGLTRCSRHGNDAGNVFSAAAHRTFLMAAIHERLQRRAFANIQEANAFRGMEFMARNAQVIHAQIVHVHRNMGKRLHGVAMETSAHAMRELA